jgi:hypothetical protein
VHALKYYLVLVLLVVVGLACFIALTAYGFSAPGLAAGAGVLVCTALFFSYGLTMRGRRAPINR